MPVTREDIKGPERAPKSLQAFVLKLGGKNPHGEPNLRVVLAQTRYTLEGGVWQKWRKGSKLNDRGGIQMINRDDGEEIESPDGRIHFVASREQPEATVEEVRWVEKYPGVKGWIIERWHPAHHFGCPEAWYAMKTPGGLPLLGPYPQYGDYEPIAGPSRDVPGEAQCELAISLSDHLYQNRQGTLEARMAQRLSNLAEKQEKYFEAKRREIKYALDDFSKTFWGSSRAMGAFRAKIAERLRARGLNVGHAGN